jgi:hypothetical protein
MSGERCEGGETVYRDFTDESWVRGEMIAASLKPQAAREEIN